jgi:hypothetical protein
MWWFLLDISGTVVDFVPPRDPAAVAEVRMDNFELNGSSDNGTYWLNLDGVPVAVRFEWEAGLGGEDALVVLPPAGMFCEPADCRVVVPERQAGSVLLFDYVGY